MTEKEGFVTCERCGVSVRERYAYKVFYHHVPQWLCVDDALSALAVPGKVYRFHETVYKRLIGWAGRKNQGRKI